MSINVTTEAGNSGSVLINHLGKREQKIVKVIKTYVDSTAGVSQATVDASVSAAIATEVTNRNSAISTSVAAAKVGAAGTVAPVAGQIGEIMSTSRPSASSLGMTNATTAEIVNVTLTDGWWLVWGTVQFINNTSTNLGKVQGGIGTTTASYNNSDYDSYAVGTGLSTAGSTTDNIKVTNGNTSVSPGLNVGFHLNIPPIYVRVTGTKTMYLNGTVDFNTSSCNAVGNIMALRFR